MTVRPFRRQAAGDAPASTPPADPLGAGLSALYARVQESPNVFVSPLGPFRYGDRTAELPRLRFFGPQASDDSWRMAFLAGFDHRDRRSSRALLALVAGLAEQADAGHGLNLAFFPVVDAAGFALDAADRGLARAHWGRSGQPELELLEQDARLNGYHGFVRVETAAASEDAISIRVRRPDAVPQSPDLEFISTEDTELLPVRFEAADPGRPVPDGPLSIADDLPIPPFELTLRVPGTWPEHAYRRSVVVLLKLFLRRYRAFQAYGQHL